MFQPFRVSAVAKDMPSNSTMRFDVLGNFTYAVVNNDHFTIGNNYHPVVRQTYVQLRDGSSLSNNEQQLNRFIQTYNPNFINDLKTAGYIWTGNKLPVTFRLQPLVSIHTDTAFIGWAFNDYAKIDPKTIWILLAIAAGILLIACINFTTLSIGRSAGRSKEVGVRKVIGAEKRQVIFQFLTEAFLLSVVSAILGLLLAVILLPWFNQLSGRDLYLSFLFSPQMLLLLTGLVLLVACWPAVIRHLCCLILSR